MLIRAVCAAELGDQIDRLAQPYVDSETVVGMTVGVVKGDQRLVRGYGQLSAGDPRAPDGRTIYELGSVSKVFTGLLLADAVIAKRVTLDTPAEDLLPSGVTMQRRDEKLPILLRHLATHCSGLPRLPDNLEPADPENPYADYDGKRLAAFLKSFRPRKRPGEVGEYSNLGVGLLGDLLAFQSKTSYESLLKSRITEPLGLADTTITLSDEQQKRLAPPHTEGGARGHTWDFDKLAGCGAIRGTADDLLKFARANMHPPEGPMGEAIELAWRVHQEPIGEGDFPMGLCWHVARDGATRWHNGQTGGYHTAVFINRPLDAAVVVLTNTSTDEVDQLAGDLIRMLAGADVKPREFEEVLHVPADVMKRYAGRYQFAPGLVLTVSVEGNKLLAGLTGQQTVRVYPRTETEWYYKIVEATLTFQVNPRGRCTAVELFQNGVRQTAKRVR
ncbi:MAG: serine hydrolase [Planctomycetales bacterium]|nr:serine hydrolase [Planctomycetales bacterium]